MAMRSMFRLLPINGHDMNKRSVEIHLNLSRKHKGKGNVVVKWATLKIVPPKAVAWFACFVAPAERGT
jgi:hypothetical protein